MEGPVQQQLDAYNERDLERFLAAYSPDAQFVDADGNPIWTGEDEMRTFFGSCFENSPDLHCEVPRRMVVGNWVIDEEKITGLHAEGFAEEVHAAVAYRVEDGKITFARVLM